MKLVDFKVRITNGGTEAVTRVIIDSEDGQGRRWSTVGVSPNIVDASFEALLDAIQWKLIRDMGAGLLDALRLAGLRRSGAAGDPRPFCRRDGGAPWGVRRWLLPLYAFNLEVARAPWAGARADDRPKCGCNGGAMWWPNPRRGRMRWPARCMR
jgi:hypothetical protein